MRNKRSFAFRFFFFCVTCFMLLYAGCSVNDNVTLRSELQHEMDFARQHEIVDISEKESQMIIDAFEIEVPSSESKLYVSTFSKLYIADWQESYLIEIVDINNREVFYETNYNNSDKPVNLYLPHFWNKKDKNGNYRYYFAFYVCDDHPMSEYTKEISKLYDEIKSARQ